MSRPPPVSGQMASPKDQTMPTEKTLPPVKYLPLRKRLTIEGMKTPKKQCVRHELNHQDQTTLSPHKYSTTTENDTLEDTNAIKNTPLAKVYKTVVIQQKMAFGKGPCNPLLWNNEDAEKNVKTRIQSTWTVSLKHTYIYIIYIYRRLGWQ
jgi:heat shock protein HslJ